MEKIEIIIRSYLAKLTNCSTPVEVDLSVPLVQGLGLSSLDMVLLITHACKEASVPMFLITEQELSNIRTGLDLVETLSSKQHNLEG